MTVKAYLAVSIDGYIADQDGGVDWLNEIPNPEQSDHGYSEFMSSIDALLMGSNTFRVVQSFGVWPYTKPVYVLSNSMNEIPPGFDDRIELLSGDLDRVLRIIRKNGHQSIYVDGGKLIRSCLEIGALDELIITHIPIILGRGIMLFEPAENRVHLEHIKTETIGIGMVKSHYKILRGPE